MSTYSENQAKLHGLTLQDLDIPDFQPPTIKKLQADLNLPKPQQDGYLGPQTIQTWRHSLIINGKAVPHPSNLRFQQMPAPKANIRKRQTPLTQIILHRGAQTKAKSEDNYGQSTLRTLNAKSLSTTFTLCPLTGIIYQHFDPAKFHGLHCPNHNVQSASIDFAGPFEQAITPLPNQYPLKLKMSIRGPNQPSGVVHCWTMTPEQIAATITFIPFLAETLNIPLQAPKDFVTFGPNSLTNYKGILAHTHVASFGTRVDGILPLYHLQEATQIQFQGDFSNV